MEQINIIKELENSPKGYLLKNKQFIAFLLKSINFNYSLRGTELTFPAPQPVSIEKKDFAKFIQYNYSVSLKLDGVRFLIYFIKDRNNVNQCILINRALQFFNIIITAEDTIYNGTLLDGELIYNSATTKWDYNIHDAVIICGNKMNKLSHSVRLEDANLCINTFIYPDITNAINIKVKDFYKFEEMNNFIENIYKKSENNDGIIFMPENLPIISGTQFSMLKWKPENKHTFDFLIKELGSDLNILIFHLGKIGSFAKVHENTPEGHKFIEIAKNLNGYKNECIIECKFNKELNNFIPLFVRSDKTHPNSLRTIERTLFNINENITLDDFINIKKE